MAHYNEQTGFPAIPLNGTMKLRVRALSATTDAEVTGVTSSQWLVYGRDESDGPPENIEPVEWLDIPTGYSAL